MNSAKPARNLTTKTSIFAALAFTISAFGTPGHAADPLPKQGSYSVTFPWHFKGQSHQVSEKENFGMGLAWGPSMNEAKRGFLDNASVLSMYTVKFSKDGPSKNSGHLIVTDSDGHKVFAAWEGGWTVGSEWEEGTMTWTGGTGKYQGISGQSRWKQKLTGFRSSGSEAEGEGYSLWKGDYRLP